jgi:hypothetical protein
MGSDDTRYATPLSTRRNPLPVYFASVLPTRPIKVMLTVGAASRNAFADAPDVGAVFGSSGHGGTTGVACGAQNVSLPVDTSEIDGSWVSVPDVVQLQSLMVLCSLVVGVLSIPNSYSPALGRLPTTDVAAAISCLFGQSL